MSQPFSFPPPPPPPPPSSNRDNPAATHGRGSYRGRGQSRGGHSRGPNQSHPSSRGQSSRGHQSRGRGNYNHAFSNQSRGNSYNRGDATTNKRNHNEAFGNQSLSRPKAPPAVPSFDIDIKSLLPAKDVSKSSEPVKRKSNALGLTPATQDPESASEDEQDDETALAATLLTEGLLFEHRGEKLSLQTPAEIKAWVAERRKRFPTKAKAEDAKKEAEEKRKQWEAEKKARHEEHLLKKKAQEQERDEQERKKIREKLLAAQVAKGKLAVAENKEDKISRARQKIERLKRRAEKAMKDLQKAEQAVEQSEQPVMNVAIPIASDRDELHESVADKMSAGGRSEPDFTSSSGSSDSETDDDDDSAPEQNSSKRSAPDRVPPPKPSTSKTKAERLCKSFAATGRCKFGNKCRYSHQRAEKLSKQQVTSTRRKGLYQVMVEKEQEEDLKRAVRAIIVLGEHGLLQDGGDQSAAVKISTNSGVAEALERKDNLDL